MKLYTDEGNFNSLKIIVAGQLGRDKLEVVKVKPDALVVPYLQKNKLPVLEISPKQFLYSSNIACRYLLSKAGKSQEDVHVDEYLEWESSQLQPCVHSYLAGVIGHNKSDQKAAAGLKSLLQALDTRLQGRHYLVGTSVTSADIAVWACLYPLFMPSGAGKDLGAHSHVSQWFSKLSEQPAFLTAIATLPQGKGASVFKMSLLAQALPPSPANQTRSLTSAQRAAAPKEKTTANAAAESEGCCVERGLSEDEISRAVTEWEGSSSRLVAPVHREHPILPKEGSRNLLITSALPYVNNVPHLGNIIGCVLSADVFSRYCRLRNYNSLYVCGTDEYGTATETKAMAEGVTPQQICDKYNKLHTDIYKWFNIDFDYFGRTTTPLQTEISQDIFWKLHKKGFVKQDSIEQLQCTECNRFLADRFVEGTCPLCMYDDARGDQCDKCGRLINAIDLIKPRCKQCGKTPIVKSTDHLFVDLPKLEPQLSSYLDQQFDKNLWSSNAKLITRSWIRDGLKPRCITRDLKWGTPVPLEGYTDKVFYVWFDAPIGYISITANYTEHWQKWWKNPKQVEMYNFMAKDNVPFHSVIFPACLLGADDDFTIVNHMSATEYLNYEDGKFSKSRGVGVFGNDAQDTQIPADIWRFYLLYVRPETQDSSFCWEDMVTKNNSELLNNLGNFINRALSFLSNSFGGVVPALCLLQEERNLLAYINRELHSYLENLERLRLRDGIRNILSISRLGNQYIQANKPWVLVKGTPEEKSRAGTVIGLSANIACLLSIMVQPYMPVVSQTIQDQLNVSADINVLPQHFLCLLAAGHTIGKPKPLFQKLETAMADELKKRFAGPQVSRQATDATGDGPKPAATVDPKEVERLNAEITKQGGIVRDLKAAKAEKSVVDEEVTKLLTLKRQLTLAQGQDPNAKPGKGGKASGQASGKKKKGGEPAKEVPAAKTTNGPSAVAAPGDPKEVERLTAEVTKQGEAVRDLKSAKAEKSRVDEEVTKLLALKRQLAIAQGLDPDASAPGGKKKKGKKK